MAIKTRNHTIVSKKLGLLVLMIITIIIPVLFTNFKIFSNIDLSKIYGQENTLNINKFTKDNYTEILTTAKHGLGNITVDDIDFSSLTIGFFNHNVNHPLIIEDLSNESLKVNIKYMEFLETTSPAIIDNLDDTISDKIYITIKFNETLHVEYNNSEARYMIYHSRYVNAKLLEFYVNNGSVISNLTEGVDFTIDNAGFLVFYYEDYFQEGRIFNFDMYLIWEFDLALSGWAIEQNEGQILEITEVEQEFIVELNYKFDLFGQKHAFVVGQTLPITTWYVALTVNPLDKEKFNYQKLALRGSEVNLNTHLNPDKSVQIKLSDLFTPATSSFSLNFTSTFKLRFEEPVGSSWAIDRLIAQREIRERIYFCSLVSGPPHVYLQNVEFYEPNIYFEETIEAYSLFDREVLFADANFSITNKRLGLNVTIPFLFVGETCPVSIKYLAFQKLKIVITDSIKMPLVGAKIEVFHFGATYGTYISNQNIQPIIPSISDENGKIVLYNVPRGNYTIKVYWEGRVVKEAIISTSKEINYVYTNVIHFPFWILIFGGISGIILIFGVIFYIKNKKLR
ncbi:MAG: hypothetical protein ACFE94_07610 [Candidatus Hodarchaeota archaeon]